MSTQRVDPHHLFLFAVRAAEDAQYTDPVHQEAMDLYLRTAHIRAWGCEIHECPTCTETKQA